MYKYGWHALSMVSRADHTNPVFVKRRNIYYGYLKFWHGMLKKFRPDAIVFYSIPHSALEFTLYGLAKVMGIKTIMLERLLTLGSRALVLYDYKSGFKDIRTAYERVKDENCSVDDLSQDLREYYEKNTNQDNQVNDDAEYAHLNTRNNNMLFRVPSLGAIARNLYNLTFFKTAKSYLNMLFSKRMTYYYDKDFTGLQMTIMTRKWGRMNKLREKEYNKFVCEPDYKKKYVYIPLAFQPEHTTLPMGGVFDDQLLMIDIVSKSLPDGWVIYVKEHLPQFYPYHVQAHTYRYKGYYEQIAQKKNVRLIPAAEHPKGLIQNAQAVATVTGTTGWEALLNSKSAIVFGSIWYMFCDGVFRASNLEECKSALQKIQNGFKVDKNDIIKYLKAVDNISIKAEGYKTRKFTENKHVSFEENISAITKALQEAIIK